MSVVDLPEADCEPGLTHPRKCYDLIGHDASEHLIAKGFQSGRIHHAWMICGPKGVGKANLAYRMSRRALGAKTFDNTLNSDPNDPVCRLIEALSHPDFFLLRRTYNEKTKKLRGEINIDEARKVAGFFAHSASGDNWRVCLVDAADELNTNAANALLKILEEPPKRCVFILIVHAPGRLLPTIRSRCRRLNLRAPNPEQVVNWLSTHHGIEQDIAVNASSLAGNAPGRALSLIENDLIGLKSKLDQLLSDLPRLDNPLINTLAQNAGKKGNEIFFDVLMECLSRHAQDRARISSLNEGNHDKASAWTKAGQAIIELARESKTIYLDPKQTIHAAFGLLQDSAGL